MTPEEIAAWRAANPWTIGAVPSSLAAEIGAYSGPTYEPRIEMPASGPAGTAPGAVDLNEQARLKWLSDQAQARAIREGQMAGRGATPTVAPAAAAAPAAPGWLQRTVPSFASGGRYIAPVLGRAAQLIGYGATPGLEAYETKAVADNPNTTTADVYSRGAEGISKTAGVMAGAKFGMQAPGGWLPKAIASTVGGAVGYFAPDLIARMAGSGGRDSIEAAAASPPVAQPVAAPVVSGSVPGRFREDGSVRVPFEEDPSLDATARSGGVPLNTVTAAPGAGTVAAAPARIADRIRVISSGADGSLPGETPLQTERRIRLADRAAQGPRQPGDTRTDDQRKADASWGGIPGDNRREYEKILDTPMDRVYNAAGNIMRRDDQRTSGGELNEWGARIDDLRSKGTRPLTGANSVPAAVVDAAYETAVRSTPAELEANAKREALISGRAGYGAVQRPNLPINPATGMPYAAHAANVLANTDMGEDIWKYKQARDQFALSHGAEQTIAQQRLGARAERVANINAASKAASDAAAEQRALKLQELKDQQAGMKLSPGDTWIRGKPGQQYETTVDLQGKKETRRLAVTPDFNEANVRQYKASNPGWSDSQIKAELKKIHGRDVPDSWLAKPK